MKWRPSSLGKLMTQPKAKSEVLSETAKSYIKTKAKEDYFGYSTHLQTKPMLKGTDWEEESIALVNQVRGTTWSTVIVNRGSQPVAMNCTSSSKVSALANKWRPLSKRVRPFVVKRAR